MFVLLMGVSGSGKTTSGKKLATELGWTFYDADDFHSPENVEMMRLGIPLNDSDRAPWLSALRSVVVHSLERKKGGVLACSALKASYRDQLLVDNRVTLIYLKGDPLLIKERLQSRTGHFMKLGMLDSQIAALEEPEFGLRVDIEKPVDEIIETIRQFIGK
jgi:gluconokinase